MKSFDTSQGELASAESEELLLDIQHSENPTETAEVVAEGQDEATEVTTEETTDDTLSAVAEAKTRVNTNNTNIQQKTPKASTREAVSPATGDQRSTTHAQVRPETDRAETEEIEEPSLSGEQPKGPPWYSRERLIPWSPYAAVILLGAILRFWQLGAKPLHHDESLHAYFALGLLHNLQHWSWCLGWNNPPAGYSCYTYDPLLHGPFQFHAIALVYQISQWLGAPDNGVNTTTVRIAAALLGTGILFLPYVMRGYLGKVGAWLATFFLAVSPSMVYFSRFAREDIYMAFFTLMLVAGTARYIRERKMRWLLMASAGFALSYATSEATFLTIAVFGSFLGALIVWEIGSKFPFTLRDQLREDLRESWVGRLHPTTFAPLAVTLYFVVLGVIAKFFFGLLDNMAAYINAPATQNIANQDLANLESVTLKIIPWLGILLGLYVFSILAREVYGKLPDPNRRRGLARFVDRRQPVLDTILTMQWTHWFFALILGWGIFMLLFTVVFTNIAGGIGDGIWKGLYYWLQQQNVDRGGQPWYYYLMLIPLYEQVGVVFSLVGIVRAVRRPTAFRLFMVYWFLGDFFIYSWAGEKMPWLMIFMTMPMMILCGIGLEPAVLACYQYAKERWFTKTSSARTASTTADEEAAETSEDTQSGVERPVRAYPRVTTKRAALGAFAVVMALLLLLPTLHNMYEVTYVHPADGPYEMMVYVQTTNDINTVMADINEVNQKDFHGNYQMRIGVASNAIWPFAWYLRDYPNLCFGYPSACPTWKNQVPVVINAIDDEADSFPPSSSYLSHQYVMRSWFDEGYKLPACQGTQKPGFTCSDPNLGSGVGPLLYLSYGDNPPPHAQPNLGLIAQRVWDWWWYRDPFGSTTGGYDMNIFIQKSMGVNP